MIAARLLALLLFASFPSRPEVSGFLVTDDWGTAEILVLLLVAMLAAAALGL